MEDQPENNPDRPVPREERTDHGVKDHSGSQDKGPGTGWYFVGLGLIAVGLVVGIPVLVWSIGGFMDKIFPDHRFAIPGTKELTLEKPGVYTLYHEYKSQIDGKTVNTNDLDLSNYKLTLTRKDQPRREIELTLPQGSSTYELGEKKARAIRTFNVSEPGTFTFEARRKDGEAKEAQEAVFTVKSGTPIDVLKNMGFACGGGCFLLIFLGGGFLTLIINFLRRRS